MLKEGLRKDDGSYPEDSSKRQRRCKESVAKVRALPGKAMVELRPSSRYVLEKLR